jgi:hemolysin activation/secretion protein
MRALFTLLLCSPAALALEISEYRIEGTQKLAQAEVEAAVYPFLGPGRALEDVEKARVALEKAYSDRGYQSVSVSIPPQRVRDGVVVLKVTEGKVGRLRVRGSRWFALSDIKALAPSVAEGQVPNFDAVVRDIYALNQLPDRRVTPALRPGALPGTIDVDLDVQDHLPLHGSLEWNNRSSAGTTAARLNGALRYDNLWQLGHSLSLNFQIAPERPHDAEVFSASYLARFPQAPWLSFTLNAVIQNSDVSTLGATAVQGRGRIFGARANFTLPGSATFFQSVSAGLDYKRFGKELQSDPFASRIDYWPATAQYVAGWSSDAAQTQLSATVVFNLSGLGSGPDAFDAKRFGASDSFIDWRGELSRTQEAPLGLQLFARMQALYSTDPLLPAEQLTAGGVESVRGYLEAQAAGDAGVLGTFEARSPELLRNLFDEWRVHLFFEGGRLSLTDALPEQKRVFFLWSTGAGTRFKLLSNWLGSLDLGIPLRSEGTTTRFHPRLQFRLWAEF